MKVCLQVALDLSSTFMLQLAILEERLRIYWEASGTGGSKSGMILCRAGHHKRREMKTEISGIESKTLPMNISRSIYLCDLKHSLIDRPWNPLLGGGSKINFRPRMVGQDPGKWHNPMGARAPARLETALGIGSGE